MPRKTFLMTAARFLVTLALLAVAAASLGLSPAAAQSGCSTPSFKAARSFKVGATPMALAAGDFNGDGKVDLATANQDANSVSVLLGDGTGSYQAATSYAAGSRPRSVVAGDFNSDGKDDLVVVNNESNDIALLLSNAAGTLNPAIFFQVQFSPSWAVVADFNGDGKPDLAVTNEYSKSVSVLLGNGQGGFSGPVNYTAMDAHTLAAGDFNGDGKPDLVVTAKGFSFITVFLNDGAGAFSAPHNYEVGQGADFAAVGEFNGDGKLDLAVTYQNSMAIMLGDGSGGFSKLTSLPASTSAFVNPVAVGDFNGDSKADLFQAGKLFYGDGTGQFNAAATYKTVSVTFPLAVDVNRDGRMDLAIAGGTGSSGSFVSVVLNQGAGDLAAAKAYALGPAPANPESVAFADFNKDGKTDIVAVDRGNNKAAVLLGDGAGAFGAATSYSTNSLPTTVATGDFNGDGKPDFVTNGAYPDKLSVFLGDGAGGFGPLASYVIGTDPRMLAVADLNGDGKDDIVAANYGNGLNGNVSVMLSTGSGFATPVAYGGVSFPIWIAIRDFSGDGKLDLVVSNYNVATVSVLLGDGTGAFGAATTYAAGPAPYRISVADFNNDAKPDLAIQADDGSTNNVRILLNNGSGGFLAPTDVTLSVRATSMVAADFNGDGLADLAVTHYEPALTVLLGDGKGNFSAETDYALGISPSLVTAADLNNDNRPDLVVGMNGVTVLLNTCGLTTTLYSPVSGRVTDVKGAGIAGVTLTISGAPSGQTLSTQTDATGYYFLNNTEGGDTLTPSKTGYTFNPSSVRTTSTRGIIPITGTWNFQGGSTMYTVTGRVIDGSGNGIPNVMLNIGGTSNEVHFTDANGNYSLKLFGGGNYTITPSLQGFVFIPTSATITNLNSDRTVRTFIGTSHPYRISGQVKDAGGNPFGGVTVTLSRVGGGTDETIGTITDANGNYFFRNVPSEGAFTVTPALSGFTFNPPNATFTSPTGDQTASFTANASTAPATYRLFANAVNVPESANSISFYVIRTGDASAAGSVDFATAGGTATERSDYTAANGTLVFAPGQSSKSITMLLTDNAYVDGNRTVNLNLSNPTGGTLGTPATMLITILDNDTAQPTSNPIDDAQFFVRQQYADFLNRAPDSGGLGYWTNEITRCGSDPLCIHERRVGVADAFFFEAEFQQTGAYVYRIYKAALGVRPSYAQFSSDRGRVVVGSALEQSKSAFALTFVQRDAFLALYPRTMTGPQFVDALLASIKQNSGVDLTAQRSSLIALFDGTDNGRAAILRTVAETQALIDAEYNRSFVLMEYYGYLRRDPDEGGYNFWLEQVNKYPLRNVEIQHAMACSFITSEEYQTRFSSVVTHSNRECPQ